MYIQNAISNRKFRLHFSHIAALRSKYYNVAYYYLISENAGYSKSIHQQAKVLAYRWFICPGSPRCAVSLNRYRYDSWYQNCGLTGIQVKSSQVGDEGAARAHVQWPEGPQWDRHHRLSSSCARFTPSASFVPLGARKGPVNGFEAFLRVNFYDRGRTGGAAPLPKTGWSAQVVNERRLSVVYVYIDLT